MPGMKAALCAACTTIMRCVHHHHAPSSSCVHHHHGLCACQPTVETGRCLPLVGPICSCGMLSRCYSTACRDKPCQPRLRITCSLCGRAASLLRAGSCCGRASALPPGAAGGRMEGRWLLQGPQEGSGGRIMELLAGLGAGPHEGRQLPHLRPFAPLGLSGMIGLGPPALDAPVGHRSPELTLRKLKRAQPSHNEDLPPANPI